MQWGGVPAVAVVSHGAAVLAFGALAAWLLVCGRSGAGRPIFRTRGHGQPGLRRRGVGGLWGGQDSAVGWAALATALWASLAIVAVLSEAAAPDMLLNAAEALRSAGWLAVLLLLSGARWRVQVLILLLPLAGLSLMAAVDLPPLLLAVPPLALSVLGMLLVEHVYRAAPEKARWGIKFACLAIGALFVFDFYLYSDAMLFRRLHPDIWAARGIVNALSAPMLAIAMARNPVWTPRLQLSRQIMFHSAALLGSALYLLAMALSAWYLRFVGGAWGVLMQVACLCGAVLLLAAVLFSGTMRARLKLFISKHFYKGRYDYREEWQRFTHALADDAAGLPERAIQAIAGLVESPAGILWRCHDDEKFQPVARWNMPLPQATESANADLCALLASRNWVIEVPEWRAQPERYGHLPAPGWVEELWLIVPLMLERRLFGFVCLAPPRTRLQLNWEVRDVLKLAASQAASYIAHRASADSLAVARQFESFNRMSTFVVHDLKNLVSQLSLLLVNAEKHKANPAFQDDMLETLSHSLAKMRHMLLKLRRDQSQDVNAPLHLDQLLMRVMHVHAGSEPRPLLELRATGLTVLADARRLERVIGHLIQNAVEATPRSGHVLVCLRVGEGTAVVEISDTGHGMSEQFIHERLFQPFVSTKAAGMGIGVFESREYLREIGGQLQVTSVPSQGTIFRVTLPLHKEPDHGEE